jgi:hypothetical protein
VLPDADAVAVPLQMQVAFPEVAATVSGVSGVQLLFIEAIHAALAGVLGKPGVSFPVTDARVQLACSAGLLSVAFVMKATIALDAPEK